MIQQVFFFNCAILKLTAFLSMLSSVCVLLQNVSAHVQSLVALLIYISYQYVLILLYCNNYIIVNLFSVFLGYKIITKQLIVCISKNMLRKSMAFCFISLFNRQLDLNNLTT